MKYLLLGSVHFDGGMDPDWSTPFEEEISAKDDTEALAKARVIVEKKYKEAQSSLFNGFDATLHGPLIKHFYHRNGQPAKPAIKAKEAVEPGLVEA